MSSSDSVAAMPPPRSLAARSKPTEATATLASVVLVATDPLFAEKVRAVVEPKEFDAFCRGDRVTVRTGEKFYRIPRRPHALIEVWDALTLRVTLRTPAGSTRSRAET